MSEREPSETTNLDRYGSPALPWSGPRELLAAPPKPGPPSGDRRGYLGTSRPDGRPHTAGIGALWSDGDLSCVSGPGTRKSRNLVTNPAHTLARGLEGIDLVLEGIAARVTDPTTLDAVAAAYRRVGWPALVEGDALTAPYGAHSAGPPPWHLSRFAFDTAFGVASAEPYGAPRRRFDP